MLKLDTLEENQEVKVKILSVKDCNRHINTQKGTRHKYLIKLGEVMESTPEVNPCDRDFEYLSPVHPQDMFAENTVRWIRGGFPDTKGQQIFPCDPPRVKSMTEKILDATSERPAQFIPKEKSNINLSGQSVTFAMAYAKDLLVAEIRAGGQFTFDQQMDYLEERSAAINQIMVKQVQG